MVRERPAGKDGVNRRPVADGRRAPGGSTLDPRTLDEIVRRVVEVAQPERIVLFGSAARGEMTRHSDVDLLIVSDRADALDLMRRIYSRLGAWASRSTRWWCPPPTWPATATATR